jgi:sialate O-acetylesterase
MRYNLARCLAAGALAFVLAAPAQAQLRLPSTFGSHMVLQQKTDVPFWGWALPAEEVKVFASWAKEPIVAKTSAQTARFEVVLQTPAAGGPHSIRVEAASGRLLLEDVMVGEVWFASGQSNMEWMPALGLDNAAAEIAAADHPGIRFFTVPKATADTPQADDPGQWVVSSPQTMPHASAVGYFFARRLEEALHVPVGVVNASWGGSPIETWMKPELVLADPALVREAATNNPTWSPIKPGAAYDAMVAPWLRFPIAGALWYQGEANVGHPDSYAALMEKLVVGWRADWGRDFPFYFVQIAPFRYGDHDRAARLREQQQRALAIPHTGMVVTGDIASDPSDIHPKNKQDVGLRLANLALAETYQVGGVAARSPLYASHTVLKGRVRITFSNAEGGLALKGPEIRNLLVAGADQRFVPAQGKVEGATLVVWSPDLKEPVAVRYAFSSDATLSLFGASGLPVAPFRTDTWPAQP